MSSYGWERADVAGKVPKQAFVAVRDASGNEVYLGRAVYNGVLVAARIIPARGSCFVNHDGVESLVSNFEYLTGKEKHFDWRPAFDGQVAAGAIATGSIGPEQLSIGRAPFKGSMCIGKIHPSHKCLYVAHEGKEVPLTSYEVLVWAKGEKSEQKRTKKKKKKKLKMKSLSDSDSDCDSDWSDCSIS